MRGRVCFLVALIFTLSVAAAGFAEWINYSQTCDVRHIAVQGSKVWCGTTNGNGAARIDSAGNVAFYTQADGLPSGDITALACDSLTVWFGTDVGLCMFNGEQFETFTRDDSGLLTNSISAIAIDPRTLDKYIGTEIGVSVYDGVNWKSYTPYNSDLASPHVLSLFVDPDTDELFVGTDFGVSVMNISDESWHQYKVQHGLVANRVSSIAKDVDGNYWFGTYQGASRFDGSSWYSYTGTNGRLSSDYVTDIVVSSDGYVWISTDKGLNRIHGSETLVFNVASSGAVGLTTDMGYALGCAASGNVWIGTSGGVLAFDGDEFELHLGDGLGSNYITSIETQGRAAYWFGTRDSGVNRLDSSGMVGYSGLVSDAISDITSHFEAGRWYEWFGGANGMTIFDGTNWWNPGLVMAPFRMAVEFVDPDPEIAGDEYWNKWVCTQDNGVFVIVGALPSTVTNYTVANSGLVSDTVNSVSVDEGHVKWFGTDQGVSILGPGGSWSAISVLDGLPSNNVSAIDFASDGVWFGTDQGVAVRKSDLWTTYQHIAADEPMIEDAFAAMVVENVGGKCIHWFGGQGGLLAFDGDDWTIYKEVNSALLSSDVRDIAIGSAGTKWVCTAGGIASIDSGGSFWVTESTIVGLLSNDVRAVLIDPDDNKWFATGGGVSKFDGAGWTNFDVAGGLCSNDVRDAAIDRVGRVWVGTGNGVCVIDGGAVTLSYNTGNSGIASNDVRAIVIDRNGIKWLATDAGVCKFDGSSWRTYDSSTSVSGLPSDDVLNLYIDSDFNLWAATALGTAKYDYAEWDVFGAEFGPLGHKVSFVGEDCLASAFWFGTEYGLVEYKLGNWHLYSGVGIGSNAVNDLKVDGTGKVWAATDGGVSVFSDGLWATLNRATGGPSHDVVNRVMVDSDDNKWFATEGGGASLYLENHDSGLSEPELAPHSGLPATPKFEGTGTEFEYSVYYFDPDVEFSPLGYSVDAYIYIDGVPYDMSLASGAGYNGRYSFSVVDLAEGSHTYYFYFVKASGNIVKLPASGVFSGPVVDGSPPTSAVYADESLLPYTRYSPFPLHFSAEDLQSGIASVALYVRQPGDDWENTGLSSTKRYGVFEYPTYVSGTFEFCTIAANHAGLVEALPDEAECTVVYDRRAPSSYITAQSYRAHDTPVMRIPYGASDGESGIDYVELWHRHEDDPDFGRFPVATLEQASGLFIYTAEKEGWHYFYTIAVDKAGNRQSVPPTYYHFSVSYDGTPPVSSCSTVEFTGTNFDVNFTADDAQSRVRSVDLYYRLNGGPMFHYDVIRYSAEGAFRFVAPQDGTYEFYTQATDWAGNQEELPAAPDASCKSDITPPTATTSCPEATHNRSVKVTYSVFDETSGVKEVTLWIKFKTGEWLKTAYFSEYREGEFTFDFLQGEGSYQVAALGQDNSGNLTPLTGDSGVSVYYETVPPQSISWCESAGELSPFRVEFSSSDEGSGLKTIFLYYRYNQGDWTESEDQYLGTPAGGSFFFFPIEGGGYYEFYTLAVDRAGNMELPPQYADCSAVLDLAPPESSASAPGTVMLQPILVDFEASDDASGVMSVGLWYSFEDGEYSRFDTIWGNETGTFEFTPDEGVGVYSFYTVATDRVSRKEAVPSQADAIVLYNPAGPALALLEDDHDFGTVLIDKTKAWNMRLVNTGNSPVSVESVATTTQCFEADFRAPVVIGAGEHLDVPITFAPDESGAFQDTVTVQSDDPDAASLVATVSGEGASETPPTIRLASTGSKVSTDDRLIVSGWLDNPGDAKTADVYVAVRLPGSDTLYFYSNWGSSPQAITVNLGEASQLGPVALLDFCVGDGVERGEYVVFGAVVAPETRYEFLSDIAILSIVVE
ncbi:MAG TPA: two-component regulator propeller domain-containing protein [bacterium]|nr:two-component regulator propeller domain-containing protein [bacterium]